MAILILAAIAQDNCQQINVTKIRVKYSSLVATLVKTRTHTHQVFS